MTTPPRIEIYELRFDNEEYYVPLGLFPTHKAAKAGWDKIKPSLNGGYRESYVIEPLVMYSDPVRVDEIGTIISLITDHNEEAVELFEEEDEEDPVTLSPGQTDLLLT